MFDLLAKITRLRTARGWTEYQLAERSGLPQSTISSWYRKKLTPSVSSLEKLCLAFGITLSQFFASDDEPSVLTAEQRELLDRWSLLTPEQRKAISVLIDTL